eukprot:5843344-Pyramimonas_sp.AAC.1
MWIRAFVVVEDSADARRVIRRAFPVDEEHAHPDDLDRALLARWAARYRGLGVLFCGCLGNCTHYVGS